jgi:hypothetical protein
MHVRYRRASRVVEHTKAHNARETVAGLRRHFHWMEMRKCFKKLCQTTYYKLGS